MIENNKLNEIMRYEHDYIFDLYLFFVKYELKGVLKCIGVKICIPPTYCDEHRRNPSLTVTDSLGTHHNINYLLSVE
jgi:hypothetical protein